MNTTDAPGLPLGEMRHFDARGARVHYRTVGSGRPLLFLHNGGSSHRIWERQLERFSTSHQCFAFDLPGFGRSANPDLRYSLDLYVDVVCDFVADRGLHEVSLVGNCMGSAISLCYAMAHPERVEHLVLFNVLTGRTIRGGSYGPIFKLTEPVIGVRPKLRAMARRLVAPRALGRRVVRSQFGRGGHGDPELASDLQALYRQEGQLAALADVLVDIASYEAIDRYTIPRAFPRTLVVWGEDNRVLPFTCGRELVATLHPHEFRSVPGGGHLLMHEHPDRVNRLIDAFLAGVPLAAPAPRPSRR